MIVRRMRVPHSGDTYTPMGTQKHDDIVGAIIDRPCVNTFGGERPQDAPTGYE